ncbi:MAG: ABC transporter substrate-binding protein [Chloroflexi bacterium]|nr:ABC transporter substrate-binding protein [Chloroflexota bacterium]
MTPRAIAWFPFISMLAVVGLILSGCAPTAAPKTAGEPAKAAPAATPKPAADAGQPKYGGILTRWQTEDPPSGDPNQENTIQQQLSLRPIYSAPLRLDPEKLPKEAVLQGDLAEKWESSADGKILTLYLRDGVKFHDGSPLTSEDVKFTLERMKSPPEGVKSPSKELFQRIAKVDAPDAKTVKIELVRPTAWFLQLLADSISGIVPKSIVAANQKALLQKPIGAGPFKFKKWDRGIAFETTKNENYFIKGKPYLDGIRCLIIPDATTQVAAFRTGQVLFTGQGTRGLTMSESKLVERDVPGTKIVSYVSTTRQELYMNVQKKPFDDIRVRKAILMVLDQKAAIDAGYEGSGSKGGPLAAEWALPETELNKMPPYRGVKDEDVAAAKKLLADAGYPNGFETGFNQGSTPQYEEMQLSISSQLRKIGINTKVRVLAYPVEMRAAAAKADFDVMQIPKISSLHDPDSYWTSAITGGSDNFAKFSDKTIDDLYAKQAATLDVAARKKVNDELQLKIWELAPSWPVLWPRYIAAAWPTVKGWNGMAVLRQNLEFDYIWLSK